jgi:superfamily II DNA or RNA helicase
MVGRLTFGVTFHSSELVGMAVGLEQQAIGRVHRMGQTKQVFVTTLVAKGTIEENIVKWNENTAAAMTAGVRALESQAPSGGADDVDDSYRAKRMEDIIRLFSPTPA